MENITRNDINIVRPLGSGGQKVVSLAVLKSDPAKFVVFKEATVSSTESLMRLLREIQLLKNLNSDFFPKNYGFNFDILNMKVTIIEEYIEGGTLLDHMGEYSHWDEIKKLLLKLIDRLKVIWEMNIVHRDLKPANIIIRSDGSPCIIDFGIARFLEMDSITNTLQPQGPRTPLYASPEQVRNDKHAIDMRSDFYALGIIALELYLGQHPFDPLIVPGTELTVLDNMMKGKYAVCSSTIPEDHRLTVLASRLLQEQPYNRPRNYDFLTDFINTL